MNLSPAIQDRIFQAADALYSELGQHAFPTVDAVRKAAKVNMNDASTGMKAWRQAQTAQISPVTIQVPSSLQQSNASALSSLWSEAVTLANESLRAAEAGWNAERAEAEALREQIANAFETQATELEFLRTTISDLQAEIDRIRVDNHDLQMQSEEALRATTDALANAMHSDARAAEIQRRADDLRKELDFAHGSIMSLKEEMAALRREHHIEIENLRTDTVGTKARSDAQLATAQADLASAREEVARLLGNLEGLQQIPATTKRRSRVRNENSEPSTSLFPDAGTGNQPA